LAWREAAAPVRAGAERRLDLRDGF
jgi:hypothetical protein